MKIDIDLPWGGKLHFERQPMSEDARGDARFTATMFLGLVLFGLFMLALTWISK